MVVVVVVVVVVHLRPPPDVQLCSTVVVVVVIVVVVVSHVKGVKIRQEHQRVIHLGRHQRARTTNLGREITLGRKIGMCTTISRVWLPRTRRMLLATVELQTTEARRVG